MRGVLVDRNGVTEVDLDEENLFPDRTDYGALRLGDAHDIWFDDEGLFKSPVWVAQIGIHPRVPLPAVILGADGEDTVAATLSVDEVRSAVSEIAEVGRR